MLVHGSFVPPRDALEELTKVVRAGRREPVPEPEPKRGLFGRRTGSTSGSAPTPPPPPVLLDVPVPQLRLPITAFGNLTSSDTRRLVSELTGMFADWERPTVWFGGGGALEWPGDRAVWARVEGEVAEVTEIARGVTKCVERLGLFVDRRVFRPMLAVAEVTTSTTGPDLEAVVGALEEFRGQSWEVDAVVLTVDPAGDGNVQEHARIPLG